MAKSRAGMKRLQCSKCGNDTMSNEDAVKVQCSLCVIKRNLRCFGWPPGTQPKKPEDLVKKPQGWHLMAEFVDELGNVYHKGIIQPELEGTLPSTPFEDKPKEKVPRQFKPRKKDREREMLAKVWEAKNEAKKAREAGNIEVAELAEMKARENSLRIRKTNRKGG